MFKAAGFVPGDAGGEKVDETRSWKAPPARVVARAGAPAANCGASAR
jgi:hypothetical protein